MELIAARLLEWYDRCARVLPWRGIHDAYRTWVSEAMLQQTRVETVLSYYDRFLLRFPDLPALASASETEVLKEWEGLGYYSRARNLLLGARQVMEKYGGELPRDPAELRKIRGIGPYTAGAVASIAFGQAVPAVDGNVMRVISRLTGSTLDISTGQAKETVRRFLKEHIDAKQPGTCNQAVMELGALVCLPGAAPECGKCPLAGICIACRDGLTQQIPVKAPKKPRKIQKKTILVIRDGVQAVFGRRPGRGLLAGMYELPSLEGHADADAALDAVRAMGVQPVRIQALERAKHIFTHIEWDMIGYMVLVEDLGQPMPDGLFAAPVSCIRDTLPVPTAFSAYTKYLNIIPGKDLP